jgi:Zn-dependent protease
MTDATNAGIVERWRPRACARCGTELGPSLLSCPACHSLVHADTLRPLAASATALEEEGKLLEARDSWTRARSLLPPGTQQYDAISARITALTVRIDEAPVAAVRAAVPADAPWWKRAWGAIATVVVLALSKLKLLLLGLTKIKTLFSMLAFFAIYWQLYGWSFALLFVLTIYVHEMGHIAAIRRLGIEASAPMFIPGLGALVLLRQHIDDPRIDARIGLAGPIWGFAAGLACFIVYRATHIPVWGAMAQVTGWINLFNLIPIWQLDGARGFHALTRAQRWMIVAACVAVFFVTDVKMLVLVALVGAYRALATKPADAPDTTAFTTFVALIVALSCLSTVTV